MLQQHDTTPHKDRGILWALREKKRLTLALADGRQEWEQRRQTLAEQLIDADWLIQAHRAGFSIPKLSYASSVLGVQPTGKTAEGMQNLRTLHSEMVRRRNAYDTAIADLAHSGYFQQFEADGFYISYLGTPDTPSLVQECAAWALTQARNGLLYWPTDPRWIDAFEGDDEGDGAPAATAPEPPTAPGGCTCVLPLVVQQDFLRGHIGMEELLKVAETAPPVGLEAKEWKEALLKRDGVGVVRVALLHHLPLDLVRALDAEVGRSRELHPGNEAMLKTLRRQSGDLSAMLVEGEGVAAVQREALQTACVALRIYLEGDADYAGTAPERPVAA